MSGPPKMEKAKPQQPVAEKAQTTATLADRRRQGYASTIVAGQFDGGGRQTLGVA